MNRAENLLFALYAHRVNILDRDQFLSICATLRHGRDIDIGMSLARRGLVDEMQMEALWSLVSSQVQVLGSARKALGAVEAGELVRQAVLNALKPQPAPGRGEASPIPDPPTIKFDRPDES